jgi:hypothetical protein
VEIENAVLTTSVVVCVVALAINRRRSGYHHALAKERKHEVRTSRDESAAFLSREEQQGGSCEDVRLSFVKR